MLQRVRRLWQHERWLYASAEATAAEVRARHLEAVLRLAPLVVLANVLNAALVAAALAGSVPQVELAVWSGLLGVASLLSLHSWWRWRRRVVVQVAPQAVLRAMVQSALMSALWAAVPLLWLPAAAPAQQLLLSVLTCGVLCAGAFVLATLLPASLVHVASLSAAAIVSLLRTNDPVLALLSLMVVVYMVIVVAGVLAVGRLFGARLGAQREAERQGQMVGLLLRDFEEHSVDVLWEVDHHGRFTHVSERLVALLGHERETLQGMTLVDTLAPRCEDGEEHNGLRGLRRALLLDKPFRDIVLRVRHPQGGSDAAAWWSVTAKPLLDDAGRTTGWRGVISDVTKQRLTHQRLAYLV